MGKRRTRFIDPANAQHFHLVHRSQRDPKANDPEAPQYVLLPARRGNAAARASVGDRQAWTEGGEQAAGGEERPQWRDHVNALGLPNDGYDYGRHLKRMGGGRFVSPSGQVGAAAFVGGGIEGEFELPEDPEEWGKEDAPKPVVEGITLAPECMDEDLEAALFQDEWDGSQAGEEFEDLDDDFVLQAGKEPDEEEEGDGGSGGGGFDFEAHMARLIERSERSLGFVAARGWEEGELEGLERLPVPLKYRTAAEEDEDDDAWLRAAEKVKARAKQQGQGAAAAVKTSAKERRQVEEEFAELLAEYGEEEIGELEDPAEEDAPTKGQLEADEPGAAEYLEHVLDDFLAKARIHDSDSESGSDESEGGRSSEEEAEGAAGLDVPRHRRRGRMGLFTAAAAAAAVGTEGAEAEEEEEVAGLAEGGAGGEADADEDVGAWFARHEYLGDREAGPQWDCETIVSTFSTLDNHPSVIAEPSLGRRKGGRNKQRGAASAMQVLPEDGPAGALPMVELSRKSGLPLGVLPARGGGGGGDSGSGGEALNMGAKRDKHETEEERRARKAAVKQARREQRQKKKEVAGVFKEADKASTRRARNPEGAVSRSVFKYS